MEHAGGVATFGPSFAHARVIQFSSLSPEEQEHFVRFFSEQKVQVCLLQGV